MTTQQRITNKRSFYDGGKKTLANRDFWMAGTSDFETLAQPDRATLRSRARWLNANNAIMANIDRSIINNVVGTGVPMTYESGNKTLDRAINKSFKKWGANRKLCDATGRLNFFDLQRTVIQSRMVDGEIFIHKIVTEDGLKLRVIEADNLDESVGTGGLTIDAYGVITHYNFRDANNNTLAVPADAIINYYRSERPSQYRGISEYKQAIVDIKNFSAFQTATIESARARANIAYSVTTPAGSGAFTNTYDGIQVEEINGVHVKYFKPGETVNKLDPSNAGSDYAAFSESSIRLIATARSISYELSFKDFSRVNYASSRASLLQDYKRFDYEQAHIQEYFLDEVFEAWLDIEVMSGRIRVSKKYYFEKDDYLVQRWIWPQRPWVDPLKDISALEKEIALGLTNATDQAVARGGNYQVNMMKKQKELEWQDDYEVYDEMHRIIDEPTTTEEYSAKPNSEDK